MSVSFRSASEDARGTTNPPVLVPPLGTTSGDYLLAVQVSDKRGSLSAMTAPTGWLLLDSTSRSDVGFVKVWRKIATGSEPTEYTFVDSTSAHSSAIIVGLTGYDPSQPLAVTPTFSNGASSTTHTAASVTGVAGGMLITAHIAGTNGTTRSYTSIPSGMTRAQDSALSSGGYILLGVYYQALPGAGATGSKIATCSTSAPFITMSLVVQQPSTLLISPAGISSSAAFGSPTVNIAGGSQTVNPVGIPPAEAFGAPAVTRSDLVIAAGFLSPAATGTTVSIDKPADTATDDIILVALYKEGPAADVTPPAGFTQIGHQAATGAQAHETYLFWKRAEAAEDASYTFALSISVFLQGFAVAVRGCLTGASPIDAYNGNSSGTADVATSPAVSVTTTAANRILVWLAGTFNWTTWTPPPGYTALIPPFAPAATLLAGGYAVQTVGGPSGTVQTTTPESYTKTAHLVALIQAGELYPASTLFPGAGVFPGETPEAAQDQTVIPAAIGSAETFGSPVVALADGAQIVLAVGVDSAELFPIPTVTVDPVPPPAVEPIGIVTGEIFGRPTLSIEISTPSPTEADQYFIDAVSLRDYATRIETAEGLLDTPSPVGDNVSLPGRDGELQVFGEIGQPRRADSLGRITFDLWLKGLDPTTGLIPGGSSTQEQWFARWDDVVRRFFRRRVVIDHARPDGTIRRAFAHFMPGESITPSRSPSSPWFGRFRAVFAIPGAHWTDLASVTTGQVELVTNGFLDLSVFAAATAPCTELQVVFGRGNNPRLSTSTGHIGWNGAIVAGRQLGIDTATGFTHQASGTSWVPGFDGLTYSPGPRLFEVDPSEPLGAIFTHTTGAGVTMAVEVIGKRRYRTS